MAFLAPLVPTGVAPQRRALAGAPPRFLSMNASPPPPRDRVRRSPDGRGDGRPRRPPPRNGASRPAAATSDTAVAASWQEQLRLLLSPSMNRSARATLTTSLLRRSPEVLRDVQAAACAALGAPPPTSSSSSPPARVRLGGGDGRGGASGGTPGGPPAGVGRVVRQVTEDVLSDVLRNGPTIARTAVSSVASTLADVAANPGAAVAGLSPPSSGGASTDRGVGGGGRAGGGADGSGGGDGPYGLETPAYEVLASRPGYEVRRYAPFTIASTVMPDAGGAADGEVASALASGGGFNTLARYLFGGNATGQSMAMTTPVITTTITPPTISGGSQGNAQMLREMAFVLPASAGGVDTAPAPRQPSVTLAPAGDTVLAVVTFSGWATEGEVRRQKSALLSALAADGVALVREDEQVVMQYDPPGTPPLSRRNEVAVQVVWEDSPVVV